jgi:predicted GNAT superfamily acetyltransferase
MTAAVLRPYAPRDADTVLSLNQSHLDSVGPLDAQRLQWLVGLTDACLVAVVDEATASAQVGQRDGRRLRLVLPPGTAYDSPNYRWFSERYDSFSYLDRVVVADGHQRMGIGRLLYDAVEARARERGRMTLEVYAEPPNVTSLAFHAARGYSRSAGCCRPTARRAPCSSRSSSRSSSELG